MAGSAAAIYLVSSLGSSGKNKRKQTLFYLFMPQNSGFLFFGGTKHSKLDMNTRKEDLLQSPKDVGLKRKAGSTESSVVL